MSTTWEAIIWNVARAGGFTAYILLALSVLIGLALSTPLQSASRWPRLINSELHNFLSLLGTIFLVVHVLAVWIDPFTKFGWRDVLIPFINQYRVPWMSLGIVALYLGIAIGLSTLARPYIGYSWWRRLHYLTFAIFVLATIHSMGTGTDSTTWWGLTIYVISSALTGLLLTWRIMTARAKRKQQLAKAADR
jgi:predicted ferric reductase